MPIWDNIFGDVCANQRVKKSQKNDTIKVSYGTQH